MISRTARQFISTATEVLHKLHDEWTAHKIAIILKNGDNLKVTCASFNAIQKSVNRCLTKIKNTGSSKHKAGSGRP